MKCKYCGAELTEGSAVCPTCGMHVDTSDSGTAETASAPVPPVQPESPVVRFCTKCGNELTRGGSFCNKCGTPVSTMNARVNAEPPRPDMPAQPAPVRTPVYPVSEKTGETAAPEQPENKTEEYVYICPQCRRIIYADEAMAESLTCFECGVKPVFSGKTKEEWFSMSNNERREAFGEPWAKQEEKAKEEKAKEEPKPVSSSTPGYQQYASPNNDSRNGWVVFLKIMMGLFIVLGTIGSFILANKIFEWSLDDAWVLMGILGTLFVFFIAGWMMVFLDMAEDIRSIKNELRRHK